MRYDFTSEYNLLKLVCFPWASVAQFVGHHKGCQLDSRLGHMPGLQARSPIRVRLEGSQSMLLSHFSDHVPLFLPPFHSV